MSHTIGQITESNQKSQASQDSSPLENKTDSDVSLLSDADYEFLFNQLLEGVAHGWHDRRIIKFFDQLGDRGKQEDWVAWLERLRSKIVTLPLQSKRQLGTIMIRLGELTQSNPEIGKIGTVSNRIGRELLFGNTEDVIWEYVGPDLILDTPVMKLETEETFSERLPEDFTELGSTAIKEKENAEPSSTELTSEKSIAESSTTTRDRLDSESEEEFLLLDLDSLEDLPQSIPVDNLPSESVIKDEPAVSMVDEAEKPSSDNMTAGQTKLQSIGTFEDRFEFELDSAESELVTEDLIQTVPPENIQVSQQSPSDQQKKPLSMVESANSLSSAIDSPADRPQSKELSDLERSTSVARVMNLIREDEKLAQEISKKLNISKNTDTSFSASVDLDSSSIDLIEGWFNLGLKQVSGGEFDKAIVSWEKALNINPNLSEAWHNRGSALGRLGKYKEAVESFQKALTIDPDNYQAWNDRAHALYQLENWTAAADSWSNAIKITPGNHLFWYNRGCALEQLKSWAESISSYEKSLEIKPDFQPARSRYTNLIADNSRSN